MTSKFHKAVLGTAREIQATSDKAFQPPEEPTTPRSDQVILRSLVRDTRGYIESTVDQINGTYENAWYDSCAVMIRRLLETLIIEAFENHRRAAEIQNSSGDFLALKALIDQALKTTAWNLGKNTKRALRRLKEVGDQSAHSRRFIAHRGDIEHAIPHLRPAVQELVSLAGYK